MIKFGPAGNDLQYYEQGFKATYQYMEYLNKKGLNLYEYECTRGVNISDKLASMLKQESNKYNIELSIHSPYYISLSTPDENKQINSIKYIIDTMTAAKKMGAKRIVVHAGSTLNMTRDLALEYACRLLKRSIDKADSLDLGDITICPETMGKINQLGNSEEIIKMCKIDNRLIPTIDFGHLYCRKLGKLNDEASFESELMLYISELGYDRMKHFHCHFSKMIYTDGGEKKHVTFSDNDCGPNFEELAKVLKRLKLEPHIICESAGTQSIDSIKMKSIYQNI